MNSKRFLNTSDSSQRDKFMSDSNKDAYLKVPDINIKDELAEDHSSNESEEVLYSEDEKVRPTIYFIYPLICDQSEKDEMKDSNKIPSKSQSNRARIVNRYSNLAKSVHKPKFIDLTANDSALKHPLTNEVKTGS